MIVISILATDCATLRARAQAQAPFADALELRLDNLSTIRESDLAALISALAKPVIAAVNAPDAFGTFAGTREERFALLERAARAGAAFVDIDWKEARFQPPLPHSCRRIVSRHVLDETPADIPRAFAALALESSPTDRLKFVTHAKRAEDGVRLLEFIATVPREVIGFTSGDAGSFTRILAPIFGSRFTFAAPTDGPGTAPGQIPADILRAHWPEQGVSRATAIQAVLGRPARHSLSPRLHGAVLRAAERDAVYVAIEPEDATVFLSHCRSPNWRGFSVTAPFKESALEYAATSDDLSRACGATNTLIREGDGWRAVNTDVAAVEVVIARALSSAVRAAGDPHPSQSARRVAGVAHPVETKRSAAGAANAQESAGRAALDAHQPTSASRAAGAANALGSARHGATTPSILVVGTGGAARAALVAAKRIGVQTLCVTGRTNTKVKALAQELSVTPITWAELVAQTFDVVIHCTPAGSHVAPNDLAVPREIVKSARAIVEAVYRPTYTPLVRAAESAAESKAERKAERAAESAAERTAEPTAARAAERAGPLVVLGREWFLEQAVLQARHFGADESARDVLRAELESALAAETTS